MNRRGFIGIAGGGMVAVGTTAFLLSDKSNVGRQDLELPEINSKSLTPDENHILFLASLAPSGHNTQPWFVQHLEPYHWIIGNDKTKWLTAVDPTQRETILSLGTFIQNLEYAAGSFGYDCSWTLLAASNQDERIIEVKLTKSLTKYDREIEKIKNRRTVRSNYLGDLLKKDDVDYLTSSEPDFIDYLPATSRESQYLNEQTIEANRIQADSDPAQKELSDWIRFSSKDAAKYRDGLTAASMEIGGVSGFVVRNFYSPADAMDAKFRQASLDKVKTQVSQSAGWMLITSKDDSVATLLETGRRMQRLFLKVREKGIAIHPMTQILEEAATKETLNRSIGINESVQFILRVGYVKDYPPPVSLRRPVEWFLRK